MLNSDDAGSLNNGAFVEAFVEAVSALVADMRCTKKEEGEEDNTAPSMTELVRIVEESSRDSITAGIRSITPSET